MYSEVDLLILESFVECSYCGDKKVKCISFSTTITAVSSYTDADGHNHEHDSNCIESSYECSNGHKFNIKPLNSCWCGWRQNVSCGVCR